MVFLDLVFYLGDVVVVAGGFVVGFVGTGGVRVGVGGVVFGVVVLFDLAFVGGWFGGAGVLLLVVFLVCF